MLRVSSEVKLSPGTAATTLSTSALALVALGTGLVLVTYVTPMATVADTLDRTSAATAPPAPG